MSQPFSLEETCSPPSEPTGRRRDGTMTVGELSRRTGVPVKALRHYADTGLVYTIGRSSAGYRLFDADAFWCLRWIATLRGLGLTVAEIRDLAAAHERGPIGPMLAERLAAVRERTDARIAELRRLRTRVDAFEAEHADELSDLGPDRLFADNPRRPATSRGANVSRDARG